MSAAVIGTSWNAWCETCADGSELGLPRSEAQSWAEEHNKMNHESHDVGSPDVP